jgi:hypothetical protein
MTPLERLKAAIRAFTVDARNESGELIPNGAAEQAVADQLEIMAQVPPLPPAGHRWAMAVAEAGERACSAMSDDCRELREAAEAYFGEDFQNKGGST